jgi:secondary thiamine-phosphate synthase enzyme
MKKVNIQTTRRIELVDITGEIQNIVAESNVGEGVCFIFCPHTTAGLTINENADPSVRRDIINALNRLIPEGEGYSHAEGNADSHIKSSLFGSSLVVFVKNGQLVFGAWQGVYFCESDGPRSREVWIKILSDNHP